MSSVGVDTGASGVALLASDSLVGKLFATSWIRIRTLPSFVCLSAPVARALVSFGVSLQHAITPPIKSLI